MQAPSSVPVHEAEAAPFGGIDPEIILPLLLQLPANDTKNTKVFFVQDLQEMEFHEEYGAEAEDNPLLERESGGKH